MHEHDLSSAQLPMAMARSHDQLPPSTFIGSMPTYHKGKTKISSLLSVDWTLSESAFDFNGRWIMIDGVEVGHVHFHLNTTMWRIQIWILESKAWEEHIFRLSECDHRADHDDITSLIFQNQNLISLIMHAKSCCQ